MSVQYKKIGIVRIDKIGDLLLTTPVLKLIKKQWPNSKTVLIASKQNAGILEKSALVDKIYVYKKKSNFLDKFNLLKKIRNENLDLCLVFSPINAAYYLCFFSNANIKGVLIFTSRYKKIFKITSYRLIPHILSPFFAKFILKINRYNKNIKHHSIAMIELLQKVGCKINLIKPKIILKFNNRICKKILNNKNISNKEIILIHLSIRWMNQFYSIKKLIALVQKIKKMKNTIIILTNDNNDNKMKTILKNKFNLKNSKIDDLINKKINKIMFFDNLNFEDLKNIIKISKIIITPHTAVSHIAVAANNTIFDIYNSSYDSNKIFLEYGPIFSKFEFFEFDKRNILNKLITKKIKIYINN